MATDDELVTVSQTEESALIIGTYILGPMTAGISICLMIHLVRHIKNAANHNKIEYFLGSFSILFTILLNISYSALGTDLVIPWEDNNTTNSYDNSTMIENVKLCIFLWYFGKLFFYLSFIVYAYSVLPLQSTYKLYLKFFVSFLVLTTISSVSILIYMNQNIYQIAVTPLHSIQLITQLKGDFLDHSNSITEIASVIPLLIDLSCIFVLCKAYFERSAQLHADSDAARTYINTCVKCLMLLLLSSASTWALYINIFFQSAYIWILLPLDLCLNNFSLFLIYPTNNELYFDICNICHSIIYNQCFNNISDADTKKTKNNNELGISSATEIVSLNDTKRNNQSQNMDPDPNPNNYQHQDVSKNFDMDYYSDDIRVKHGIESSAAARSSLSYNIDNDVNGDNDDKKDDADDHEQSMLINKKSIPVSVSQSIPSYVVNNDKDDHQQSMLINKKAISVSVSQSLPSIPSNTANNGSIYNGKDDIDDDNDDDGDNDEIYSVSRRSHDPNMNTQQIAFDINKDDMLNKANSASANPSEHHPIPNFSFMD